jgi:[acyl-carrier-protein] S-malonyltransferase
LSGGTCLLFSGQSIQEAGFCRELWRIPAARRALDRLSPVLGEDLEWLTTESDEETLAQAGNAQRAIHAHHLGHLAALQERRPGLAGSVSGAAGHSVGVVAALVAAGSLSVEDSGRFVRERARAFADVCASLPEPSGLAAVTTESLADLEDELPAFPGLSIALENAPGKATVGGPIASLEELARVARREDWPVRVTLLKVAGPYHTPAFAPCGPRLSALLERLAVEPPSVPVFSGTTGRAETDPDAIRRFLSEQPFRKENHLAAIRVAWAAGCRRFVEASARPQPVTWVRDQLDDPEGLETFALSTEDLVTGDLPSWPT